MKKLFLSLALALGATTAIYAQDIKQCRVGATVGANFSSNNADNAKNKTGFNVGIRGEYNFSNFVYLGSELLFDQKGVKYDNDAKMTQSYISLPIHIGYRYTISESLHIFGEFGPYFAYGIAGETEVGNAKGDTFKDLDDGGAGTKRFDCGLGFRIGAEFSNIQLHIGYDLGLTGIADDDNPLYVDNGSEYKNKNISVGIAYMF